MEIRQQNIQPYLHDIAIDQLMADYTAKGYQVSKEDTIGNYHPDLVARKGDEVVIVEVKSGKLTPEKRRQVVEIGDYVRAHKNHKFLVVLANPPKLKRIDIPNLDHLLLNYLVDNSARYLNGLPQYTRITEVTDVVVNEISINDAGSIVADGNGNIEVVVGYSSSEEDGVLASDIFSFNFLITLNYDERNELRLTIVDTLEIDVSSFTV